MRNPMQPLPSPEHALDAGAGADIRCGESVPSLAWALLQGLTATVLGHGLRMDSWRIPSACRLRVWRM